VAIEDAGWDIRDCVMWVYGSGFPKSHDVSKAIDREAGAERDVVGLSSRHGGGARVFENQGGTGYETNGKPFVTAPATEAAKQWQGWGTALKPAYEPIIVARKPLRGTVAGNVLEWGTGGINVDGCRIDGEPWKPVTATGLGSVKFFTEGDTPEIEKHPHALGRWPANFIHDGSEEVTGLLGDAARFFYCPKASKRDRDEGCEGMEEVIRACAVERHKHNATSKTGELQRLPRRNHHPTVKPTDLMRYLCRLVTPPDGWVLDPFTGSGSTGKAAVLEGFRFVGCELSAEYIEIARARIGHAAGQSRQKELALA
jgi:site-specific DNA-methyltransferase (adenine-specific)